MEKKTFGEFIKAIKGKIVKGTIIVVGLVAGIVVIKLLTNNGEETLLEAVADLSVDGLDAVGNLGEIAG